MSSNYPAKIRVAAFAICLSALRFASAETNRVELSPPELFQSASQSVVRVFAEKSDSGISMGSGVFVRAGLVATNCHVIEKQEKIVIKYKKSLFNGNVIYSSPARDLCIIDIKAKSGVSAVLFKTSNINPGMRAYAIGAPQGFDLTISEGLVSGVRYSGDSKYIQTSTPISKGSSGGGLFSSDGRLIGLTTFIMKEGQNINFALPSDWIEEALLIIDVSKRGLSDGRYNNEIALDDVASDINYWVLHVAEVIARKGACNLPKYEFVRDEFLQTIWVEAKRSNTDPNLLIALVISLSECRKHLITEDGARGYFRIPEKFASEIGVSDPSKLFHMQTNIRIGAVLLRHLMDKNVSMDSALVEFYSISYGKQNSNSSIKFSKQVLKLWGEISKGLRSE